MLSQSKPRVLFSECLGFSTCRYNGQTITDPFIELLKGHVDSLSVCPEMEIDLGVPREPLRLVENEGSISLIQPGTGRDLTQLMHKFTTNYLDKLGEVDGFVLKYRSPSCGTSQVKIYNSVKKGAGHKKGAGAFGAQILKRFGGYPIEDEGRLQNFDIRQHFLTQLFCLARFREVYRVEKINSLVRFHTQHKYLLMAYNQQRLRGMGQIVANTSHQPYNKIIEEYRNALLHALARAPRRTSEINVLLHLFGYVSDKLNPSEKAFFLDELKRYREHRICLSAVTGVLRSWILRFEVEYLMDQYYFQPFPEELIEVTDSGKGRVMR
jgi:uncharacterized protein YbgA (DUF1722 family)/uncharacterized protein YbbK (DUF523 family)